MDKNNVEKILEAMINDCGDLIGKSDMKSILNEALIF